MGISETCIIFLTVSFPLTAVGNRTFSTVRVPLLVLNNEIENDRHKLGGQGTKGWGFSDGRTGNYTKHEWILIPIPVSSRNPHRLLDIVLLLGRNDSGRSDSMHAFRYTYQQ